MTNFERYKTNIADICDTGDDIAIVNGVPVGCNKLYDCTECDFDRVNETCNYQLLKWATSEYKEPAPKLTKREREFLECFELKSDLKIMRACVSEMLFVVSKDSTFSQRISHDMFSFIEPYHTWTFEELMKLEVE